MSETENLPALSVNAQVPSNHEMMVYQTMAKQAVSSKMYRGIGDESGVMTIMLSARELGIPPMAALNGGLNIINGKVEISARMMSSLIRKAGHSVQVKSSTDDACTLIGKRADNGDHLEETFTMEEAKRAGLVKDGGGWKKFPKDMLYARCLSRLARRLFADVIGVGYVEGEIREVACEVVESQPDLSAEEESKFFAQFDKEEALAWSEYITQVQQKMGLSRKDVIDKYYSNPTLAQERFAKWRSLQVKNA